jgi:hypothetical protein
MFSFEKYPPHYPDIFDARDIEKLVAGIGSTFIEPELSRALYLDFDFDWENKMDRAPFDEQVLALAKTLRRVGQLHWLIRLLDDKRPGFDVFVSLRVKATPPLAKVGAPTSAVPPGIGPAGTVPIPAASGGFATGGVHAADSADAGAEVDPWQLVLLHTDQPFLDRAALRAECKLVGLGRTRPILSIGGDPDTGKSYSADYLLGVTKSLRGERPIVIKKIFLDRLNGVLETGASADIRGARLARRLAMVTTGSPLPDYIERTVGSEQDMTWAADAVDWIMSNAVEAPLRWLVLDGFERTVLSPSAQALIESLIAAVADDPKIRITVLGYPGDLSWCAASVRLVRLDLAEFADREKLEGHVLTYLHEVQKKAAERARPPFTADQLLNDARSVLTRVNPAAPDLTALEAALTKIAERVLVGP